MLGNAQKSSVEAKLLKSLEIIRKYDWLVDASVFDFYVANHWGRLDTAWRSHLDGIEPEQLSELLDWKAAGERRLWPLSLLALRTALQELCLNREPTDEPMPVPLPHSPVLANPKMSRMFMLCVKSKKRHEIQRMAAFCKRSCNDTPVDFVVDFGAGMGHLARALGYGYGVRVCCLEQQAEINDAAKRLDIYMEGFVHRCHLPPSETVQFRRPAHVTLRLTADMQPREFINIVKTALELPDEEFRFGIIGLHACGELGVILMRMFLECPQAKFLNLVACCHQKLTVANTRAEMLQPHGYPLSSHLQTTAELAHLSYESREVSCHANEIYCTRLTGCDNEYLKIHSFRAAAERILVEHSPNLPHGRTRNVKHVPGMEFMDYFYKAVAGSTVADVPPTELLTAAIVDDLQHWKRVVVFQTLRLMIAPLVESVILYDRVLFLLENHCQVSINAIFDPRLSPRNHLTSAVKLS